MELPVHKGCICTKVEYLYTEGVTVDKWSTCTQGEKLYASGVPVHKGSNCTQVKYLYTRGETIHKWSTCTQGGYLYTTGAPEHNGEPVDKGRTCTKGE